MSYSRRRSNSRRRWTQLTFWLMPALYAASAAVVAIAATASPLATIRRVRLVLSGVLEAPEMRCTEHRAHVQPGMSLALFDTERCAESLRRLPWVRSVRAETTVTGDLIVRVAVRRPEVVVSCGGRRWEVDEDGFVVRPARKGLKLTELVMCDPAPLRVGFQIPCEMTLGGMAAAVIGRGVHGLKPERIAVDQTTGICFNNGDKVAVCLGPAADLPYKIALIDRIYREDPQLSGRLDAIDLSCPLTPACRRRASARTASPGGDAG